MSNKKFIADFENNVKNTINRFKLLKKSDNVLVACSGGKDSTTILYILNNLNYKIIAATIDSGIPSYNKKNYDNLKEITKDLDIGLKTFSFKEEVGMDLPEILKILSSKNINYTSCNVCGILKRYILNKKARDLNFDKIVTGHNLDDEAQSFLMNLFRGNLEMAARQSPVAGIIKDKKFVQRVKPLYLSRESDIKTYCKIMGFPVFYRNCPLSHRSYRFALKHLLWNYEETNPEALTNTINFFLKIKPKLMKKYFSGKEKISKCKICKEPSKTELCNACKIIGLINNQPKTTKSIK